jgi:hypothetical protein
MTTQDKQNLIDTLCEYGGCINITDYDIVIQDTDLLTHVYYNEDTDTLHYFAGDIWEDKHAEEIFPNDVELDMICRIITNDF